jgi:hypothetical protein
MKSLTGLTGSEFLSLVPVYKEILTATAVEKDRVRAPGAGAKHTLGTAEKKLFYILFYVKCYPTFDVAGFFYDADRSQPCRWTGMYLPLLEKVLSRKAVLPQRKISSVEEFIRLYPEVGEIFVDGTERPVQRSKKFEKQREDYSGKKKRHTRKNIVISDSEKRILLLTPTEGGRRHDYALFKESGIADHLPEGQSVFTDTGFQGIRKDYPHLDVSIPYKKPKGKKLTFPQRMQNRIISSCSIIVENAICGIKRLKSLIDVYRNRRNNTDDLLMNVGCGLWNYHLSAS